MAPTYQLLESLVIVTGFSTQPPTLPLTHINTDNLGLLPRCNDTYVQLFLNLNTVSIPQKKSKNNTFINLYLHLKCN